MKQRPRRARASHVVVAIITALIVGPTAANAGHNFTDVPDTNIFHADIEWMLDNGITSGCGTDVYCPADNVTREQMAAFMKRLATKKVVNAATAETAVNATTAGDADTLDGLHGTEYKTVVSTSSTDTFGVTSFGPVATFAEIGSVTIVAPAAGVIVVDMNATYNQATGAQSSVNWLEMDAAAPCDTGVNIAGRTMDYVSGSLAAGSTVDEFYDAGSSAAVSVDSGGPHVFSLCSESFVGTPDVMGTTMVATWVPASSASIAVAPAATARPGNVGS